MALETSLVSVSPIKARKKVVFLKLLEIIQCYKNKDSKMGGKKENPLKVKQESWHDKSKSI